ncbi:glycoside hydrolase family 15 protein [Agrococcus sp. Marseille-P2731]|uniref:glycoside hydrolase family 15 protein n=1 Tax=Agrococcus sp. Marseille-P2731 TaxID=1841862 RepID=UPI0009F8B72D|nr:glycoside hydrolase family 15 protein [Agrococcus sp. Marseille-P2731]
MTRSAAVGTQLRWDGGAPVRVALDERDPEGYADLRTYAPIGDGRTIALVARDGSIDWLPLPAIDSPPAFAALLDAEAGGRIALAPVEPHEVERRYLPGTNVLETTFFTASGVVRVTDALNTGQSGRLPWCELARRIDGVEGEVQLCGEITPGTLLGAASPWASDTVHGVVLRLDGLSLAPRVLGHEALETGPRGVVARFRTSPGSRHFLGLVATDEEPLLLPDPASMDAGIDRTIASWTRWSESCDYSGEWQEAVHRSALLLKQLIYGPTGGITAAATTSLPESLAGGKNWDYRYSWVRDTAYSLSVLLQLGATEEVHGAMTWLLRLLRGQDDATAVLHGLDGSVPGDEVTEHDVPGWRGAQPVVSGNRAASQLQLGVYGDVFNIVAMYVDAGNVLDAPTGRLMAEIADLAADSWRRKDAGMWELEVDQHYTTSKLGCWHALEQAAHLAELGQIPGDAKRWRFEADAIRDWVEEHCWSEERGAYVWYPGTDRLDASILLHAISGFDRGERMRRTLDALDGELGEGPHLVRYSGAGDEESSFVACSFWMVAARAHCGQVDMARERMELLLAEAPNDVGLLAEMLDADTGAFLGNLPQALSHLALVNAALTIDDVEHGGAPSGQRAGRG